MRRSSPTGPSASGRRTRRSRRRRGSTPPPRSRPSHRDGPSSAVSPGRSIAASARSRCRSTGAPGSRPSSARTPASTTGDSGSSRGTPPPASTPSRFARPISQAPSRPTSGRRRSPTGRAASSRSSSSFRDENPMTSSQSSVGYTPNTTCKQQHHRPRMEAGNIMNARTRTARRATVFVALAAALPIGLAACGSTNTPAASGAVAAPSTSSSAPTTASSSSTTDAMSQPFGAACTAVPKDGKGSFNGMATDPVATAASNNPVLSTLVTAVKAAGLVDTLNSAPALTVFAPTDDAFAKIPADTLNKVLADKATLTAILTHHVVAGQLDPTQVVGTQDTLNKDQITVKGDTNGMTIENGATPAKVLCGNIPTANATVYVIDSVLMPS